MKAGVTSYIVNGFEDSMILDVLADKPIGTKFTASTIPLEQKQCWLLTGSAVAHIVITDETVRTLRQSDDLLLTGMYSVHGAFAKGENVALVNKAQDVVGYGIVNFSSYVLKNALKQKHGTEGTVLHSNAIALPIIDSDNIIIL